MQLSPAELAAGADRVVEAQVTAIDSRWSADHLGLETIVTLLALDGAGTFTIVQPGGTVGEATELVFGMPVFHVGDRARYHLAHNVPALWLDGQPTWRVYGWAQGVWPERVVDGVRRFVPGDPRGADLDTLARDGGGPGGPGTVGFAINGMVWPADRIPVGYELHQAGSADLTFQQVQDTVRAAFDAWEHVPCSSLAFHLIGTTDLPVAVDGHNVISFIESGWVYGAETAGATSLFIIDGMQTADVAMNGENYTWAIGPPGALQTSGTLDLQAVLTHELGHFSGLGHTMVAHDTMYYSWTPWQGQRTPSADDKRGLCSIYPVAADECTAAGTGCPAGTSCVSTDEGRLCDTPIEPIGSACNYDHVECGNFCLFTSADLSSGYCSRYCSSDADCPATHHCDVAMAGGEQVKVCFAGAQPVVDAGPSDGCTLDDQCAAGQYCTGAGACSFDCRTDDDCPGSGVCDDHGRCAGATGDTGGGCCGASPDPRPSLAAIALGLVAGLFARGRRSRRPARSRVVR
ncbi:MAG TPA: matrixin family metalloprotease [Kofleriaceae bacterium]|nr:matrixin family metalloprotease [Kofleriaceae bacterium]